ncbi:MAG: hypothetical protein IJU21_01745, partial [Bacteroidales bacterium]|nr:hypothetical protein [Bacteroidales bacterium]
LAFVACQKNENPYNLDPDAVTFKAVYNEAVGTKSAYDLAGSTYSFKWVTSDKVLAQTYNGATYSGDLFTAVAGGSNTATFAGTLADGYNLATYAFYPNDGTGALSYTTNFSYLNNEINPVAVNADVSAESATVVLAGTITENKAYPMAHIPMIGEKDGSGNYAFTACTGILKVTIADLPVATTQVRLDMPDNATYPLNGNFVFDVNKEVKSAYSIGSYKWGQKYMNITVEGSEDSDSDGLVDSPRSFYFPIPTGTIAAGKLTVSVYDGSSVRYSVTNKVDITVAKGTVTGLPTLTYRENKMLITGTATSPVLNFYHTAETVRLRAHISTSETHNLSEYTAGLTFTTSPVVYNLTSWSGTDKLTNSGKYYLHWVALNDHKTAAEVESDGGLDGSSFVVAYGTVPFHYIKSSDQTALAGQYDVEYSSSTLDFPADAKTLTFEASDDISKGNLMLTEIFGCHSDISLNNSTLLGSYNLVGNSAYLVMSQGSAASLSPIYATFDGSKIYLYDVVNQPISTNYWGNPNFLHNYYDDQANLAFTVDLSSDGTTTHRISCDAGNLVMSWGYSYTNGQDVYYRVAGLVGDLK